MDKNPNLPGSADEFLEKNLNLARSIAWKFAVKARNNPDIKFDEDDFMSIAYLGLIKAYKRFDPTKFRNDDGGPIKFSTYAVPIIAGAIMVNTRDFAYMIRNKDRNGPKIPTDSLDVSINEDGNKEMYLIDKMSAPDNYDRLILDEFISKLPSRLKDLYELRIVRGLSQDQTGKAMGCSQVNVWRLEKKLMSLAEKYGRGEELEAG